MNLEDLEEYLSEILFSDFKIRTLKSGEIVIYSSLVEDEDGELVEMDHSYEECEEMDDPDIEFEPLQDDEE